MLRVGGVHFLRSYADDFRDKHLTPSLHFLDGSAVTLSSINTHRNVGKFCGAWKLTVHVPTTSFQWNIESRETRLRP